MNDGEKCTWCGTAVEAGDGFRLYEAAGERRATFCRLEHIIPWTIQGAHWEPGTMEEPSELDSGLSCSLCQRPLGDPHLVLVRHRDSHRIPDGFCSVDHLSDWAKAGGRWA